MEFFSEIQHPHLDIPALKNLLTIDSLPSLCASISSVTPDSDNAGNIYCFWGAFSLRRDEIRKGVRYALLDCPHALTWTITADEANEALIVHCAIDKTQPPNSPSRSRCSFRTGLMTCATRWPGKQAALRPAWQDHLPVRRSPHKIILKSRLEQF